MLLLRVPFDPGAAAPPGPPARAYPAVLGAMALVTAAGLGLEAWAPVGAGLGHGLASGAVHAGWLALGWLLATGAAPGWGGPILRLAATVIGASLVARLAPAGALAFLLVPPALLLEARRCPELRAIGLGSGRLPHAAAGLALGGFLGAHILVTASRTLGYRIHTADAAVYAAAVAYDLGVNALTAEWLFRGAVFTRLWRRTAFWPAALVATALALVRYLLDPALPHATEARVGAIFYLGLLGLVACALRAWSGSLLPGYLATLAFFAAYRLLAP
jgi:hypothetical protein